MTIGKKLGTASVGFGVAMVVCARWDLLIVLCGFFAILFGCLAAARGSKLWLAVPGMVACLLAVMMWAGFTAN
jgi:hypothetical protein